MYIYDKVSLVYLIRKEKFPVGKTKLVWQASLRRHTFCEMVHHLSSPNKLPFPFFIYLQPGTYVSTAL